MNIEQLLDLCCEMGRQLTQNGAEIYRVEESLERIFTAYGYEAAEVFAIPSCIILSVRCNGQSMTRSVRIRSITNNLNRLDRLNDLCRQLCSTTPSIEDAQRMLDNIRTCPTYPVWISFLVYGGTAFFFTLFWGGNVFDASIAFICGLITRLAVGYLRRVQANVFFLNVFAGMLLALVPFLLAACGVPNNSDKIIIGTIMLLVPGIAITNAMRDVLAGDFLTAIIRLAEVLIVSIAIAGGIALAIGVVRVTLGGI